MKVKFSKYERVAGVFVLAAIIGSLTVSAGVAIKKGWFTLKVPYQTELSSADGIHPGTVVQVSGLRAGSVESIELMDSSRVVVNFVVQDRFQNKIRVDSKVQIVRPFVIGEKVIEVTVGDPNKELLARGALIPSENTYDIMDLVSGKKLAPFIGTIESLVDNLKTLAEAFSDPKRTEAMIQMFDKVNPMIDNLNKMSIEVTESTETLNQNGRLKKLVINLNKLSHEMAVVLPAIREEAPDMGQQLGQIVKNLNILTTEFQKLTPAITEIAPDLPRTTRRAVEALDEAVVVLKALQKSFILRGSAKEVREEEREPAKTKEEKGGGFW